MKVYQTLKITASNNSLLQLLDTWKHARIIGWSYDCEKTIDYASNTFNQVANVACFIVDEEKLEPATLWIVITANTLKITNIVPLIISHLDYDNYNKILNDFYQKYVEGIIKDKTYKVVLTRPYPNINDLANKQTATKLVEWEEYCNKNDGNLHPEDEQRWFDFIITAAITKSQLETDILRRWLIEDKGWMSGEDSVVERLCGEYDNERRLLNYYFAQKDEKGKHN